MQRAKILCLLLTVCLFFGCAAAGTPVSATDSKAVQRDTPDIMCLGNSLIYRGELLQQFKLLADEKGYNYNLTDRALSGYTLDQHLVDLKSKNKDELNNIDIVIMQEHGSKQPDTAGTVKQIMGFFKPDTKFYYFITEYDIKKGLDSLIKIDNLTFIPSGFAHNLLLQDGFTYAQLHVENDYHPNKLYGYIGALALYSTLTDKSCKGMPCGLLKTDPGLVPGNDEKQKANTIDKIQKDVMSAVKSDISNNK